MERESHRRFQNICGSLWGAEAIEKKIIPKFHLQKQGLKDKTQAAQWEEMLHPHQGEPLDNAGVQKATQICAVASSRD